MAKEQHVRERLGIGELPGRPLGGCRHGRCPRIGNGPTPFVLTGKTGHAEVVQVEFDPSQVSYDDLLNVFWEEHDPTTLNRQGPDVGAQYRSAIFFHSPEQEVAAKASKERAQKLFKNKIVTEITPASEFYRAEEYHQQYLEKRGLAHCSIR